MDDKRSTPASARLIEALAGSELSSVVFVMDYIQFNFQPSGVGGRFGQLSCYTPPRHFGVDGLDLSPGSAGYRDSLVDLIRHVLVRASEVAGELRLTFDDGRNLVVSLAAEDAVGAEAAMLTMEDPSRWEVWRPGDIPKR